jgi:hypothetical protein
VEESVTSHGSSFGRTYGFTPISNDGKPEAAVLKSQIRSEI